MRYLKVSVRGNDKEIKTMPQPPRQLRELLLKNKVSPYGGWWMTNVFNCHGKGLCGMCAVRVVDNPSGLTDKTKAEEKMLWASSPQTRLSCQAYVCGDVTVDVAKVGLAAEKKISDEAKDARAALEAGVAGQGGGG